MNVTRAHLDKEQYLGREGILVLSVYPLSVQRKHGSVVVRVKQATGRPRNLQPVALKLLG